jgi:DNA-binding NarL/FixJ family response regulator
VGIFTHKKVLIILDEYPDMGVYCMHTGGSAHMTRILLYSAVPVVTKGFAVLLSAVPEFELVAVCSNEQQLSKAITAASPDLALIDLDDETPLDRLFELRREVSAPVRIVLWVQSISPELAYQTMRLGVRGILRKSLGGDVIVKCLQKVSAGECWFEEALTASFASIRTVKLTQRESQLLSLISRGFKNKEIASALLIAEPTVKVYLSRLFRKVGAKDRLALALYGLRNIITGQVSVLSGAPSAAPGPLAARLPVLVPEDSGRRARARPQPLVMRSIA